MKLDHRTALWKGRNGRLWRLADRLQDTAEAVRYAQKPYDLVFPITRLIDLANQVRDMQWEWLAKNMGLDPKDRGHWPRV